MAQSGYGYVPADQFAAKVHLEVCPVFILLKDHHCWFMFDEESPKGAPKSEEEQKDLIRLRIA